MSGKEAVSKMRTPLEELKQAFLGARIRDLEEIKLAMPGKITFSRRHMHAMKRIIHGKTPYASHRKTLLILVAALLALLAGCTIYVTRNEIANFIEELFDDHAKVTTHTPEENAPKTIETPYTLTYVPEGYQKAEEEISILKIMRYWKNSDEKQIYFEQRIITSGGYIDVENSEEYEQLIIGSNEIYFRNIDGQKTYCWTDNRYVYQLRTDEIFSTETLTSIFEGIKPINP